jgi:hypothetical protein
LLLFLAPQWNVHAGSTTYLTLYLG